VEAFVGWDYCGGAVFSDDSWTRVGLAGLQGFAGVDCRREFLAFEQDWGFERGRRDELCSAWTAGGGRPHMVLTASRVVTAT